MSRRWPGMPAKILVPLMACGSLLTAAPRVDAEAIAAESVQTHDSTGFDVEAWRLSWLARYRDADHYIGLDLGQLEHRQPALGIERRQRLIGVTWRDVDPDDGAGSELALRSVDDGYRKRLLFDVDHLHRLGTSTRLEFFASRAPVDTAIGLNDDLHLTHGGVGIEQRLTSRWSAVADVAWVGYSDHGQRHALRSGLVFDLAPQSGVTLQWRGKWLRTDRFGEVGGYFAPDRYQEQMAVFGWAQRSGPWRWRLRAGLGAQRVNDESWKTARLLDVDVRYTLAVHQQISLRYQHTDAAERLGPDTTYRTLTLRWLLTR